LSYVLGQYNKNRNVADDDIFMTLVTSGTPDRRDSGGDSEVIGDNSMFKDECVKVNALSDVNNYYFHGKIQRMTTDQTFQIKLVFFSPTEEQEGKEQYIKTITVSKGNINEWVDVEFVFSPLLAFDCILFELQRTVADYRYEVRYPHIAYEELSVINNIINSRISDGAKLIKIGVQSHPGLMMCINGEEIRTCRTGVYELKNGIMTVRFFSIVAAIEEDDNTMVNWINNVNTQIEQITEEEEEGIITPEEAEAAKAAIPSACFFGSSKKPRHIDSFTLDYMYKED